jgi:hypothetical protein
MRLTSLLATAAVAAAVVIGVVAFASRTSVGPAAAPTASAAPALTGSYTGTVAPNSASTEPGVWQLAFISVELLYTNPLGGTITQIVTVVGPNEISLSPDTDCSTGTVGPGDYRWTMTGNTLTFEPVNDPSPCRKAVLTGRTWTRQPGP